jgi:hypothetical protein
LLALCQRWKPSLQVIPQAGNEEHQASWGPSLEELLSGGDVESLPAEIGKKELLENGSDEEPEDGDTDFDSDDASGEEDLLESIAFTEIYHDCSSKPDVEDF